MADKIEIDVRINGKVAKLSDISDEALGKIKEAETQKPIEHGDYGYLSSYKDAYRLFVMNAETNKIDALDRDGCRRCRNVNDGSNWRLFTLTGNVFKDMENTNGLD